MAHPPPDHRARRIEASVSANAPDESLETLERAFFHFVKTGEAGMPEVPSACELYQDEEYRHLFSALALAEANGESVASGMGISETAYAAFRSLFFDVKVFPHNPAKTRYVKRLDCPDDFRQFYEVAIERGASELIERYRIGARPRLEPENLIYDAMGDMWTKFLSHRGFNVTSDTAKEAFRWGEGALRTAKLLLDNSREERRNAGTTDDLRIALEIRNETKTLEDLDLSPEDLVVE